MRRVIIILTACVVVAAGAACRAPGSRGAATPGARGPGYLVLYKSGVPAGRARAAVEAAGGTIVTENTAVGLASVRSADPGFTAAALRQSAFDDVTPDLAFGRVPGRVPPPGRHGPMAKGPAPAVAGTAPEPLAGRQWDMAQIHATMTGSYKVAPGDRRVLVGVIDSGIDGTHPDIAPNFDRALSRNFTMDVPVDADGHRVDGPCEHPSCVDPVDEDGSGHGTHVASTIAAPINGLGIAGVAPGVTLVNLRAGTDSGLFFLRPVVDALTYAGDAGIDVVNMSFFIDPWLFNCPDNPADSPAHQAEQRMVIDASRRALAYAHAHGVTLVAAAQNTGTDHTKTGTDVVSPDYASVPGEKAYDRSISPSCVSEPAGDKNVIVASAVGIGGRKAPYSTYGDGYVTVSAPGGDAHDTPGGGLDVTQGVLGAYPKVFARAQTAPDGTPRDPALVRDCQGTTCAYYEYMEGTSMAAPHVAGVAALIVSRYGRPDPVHGGLTLAPDRVRSILQDTATRHPCPSPLAAAHPPSAARRDRAAVTQGCAGPASHNGFYGYGIVDALNAVR